MFTDVLERNRTPLQSSLHGMNDSELLVVKEALDYASTRANHSPEDVLFIENLASNHDMETLNIICMSKERLDNGMSLRSALRGF